MRPFKYSKTLVGVCLICWNSTAWGEADSSGTSTRKSADLAQCQMSLFKRIRNAEGKEVRGELLGSNVASAGSGGAKGVFGKLYSTSESRAIVFTGVIDDQGYFRAEIQEVDQDSFGKTALGNPKILSSQKVYYDPYATTKLPTRVTQDRFDNYILTVDCQPKTKSADETRVHSVPSRSSSPGPESSRAGAAE